MHHIFLTIAILFITGACATLPKYVSDPGDITPNYNQLDCWAAHPDKQDWADTILPGLTVKKPSGPVDIFFIHPTTYVGRKGENKWNAPITDPALNNRTDQTTILFQASLFGSVGRLFAPRYRQAHLNAYFTDDKLAAARAFALAYKDVREAFIYYLANYHQDRPIIIASHSQGTTHAKLLIKEFFDGQPLQSKLVAAYLVGIPVEKNYFNHIKPCQNPENIGCFCSWRTFKSGYLPNKTVTADSIAVINPLSWTISQDKISKEQNLGSVLYKFDKVWPTLVGAQIHEGILWSDKPKFPGSFLLWRRNYHIADYNFFYVNTQQNALRRVQEYYALRP